MLLCRTVVRAVAIVAWIGAFGVGIASGEKKPPPPPEPLVQVCGLCVYALRACVSVPSVVQLACLCYESLLLQFRCFCSWHHADRLVNEQRCVALVLVVRCSTASGVYGLSGLVAMSVGVKVQGSNVALFCCKS